jgi:predicted glycoside hydrolase/deacetylase ChbG (UPF0249 family)
MKQNITFAADDFGLTRGITDTILETVDNGPVTLVSLIPNGEAVAYAIEEYKKRSERLTLAVHLNLTEGKALSERNTIPLLVDSAGNFKYGIAGLWAAYLFGGSSVQSQLREQARREIAAQLAYVQETSGVKEIAVNGHQHVHLIPFVFDALVTLPGLASIRTVREPFQWRWSPAVLLAHWILGRLSERAARTARLRGIATNDTFIGFIYSGRMTERALRTGLARAEGSVEVLLHPGSALLGELDAWKGSRADLRWHYSPWRVKERALLRNMTSRMK